MRSIRFSFPSLVLCAAIAPLIPACSDSGAGQNSAAPRPTSRGASRRDEGATITGTTPTGPLAETDANGSPALYYGRVRFSRAAQLDMLRFLGYGASPVPFFDEYDSTRVGQPSTEAWRYVIASGKQWNLLIDIAGIVDEIQMSPRADGVDHPILDSLMQGDALDAAALASNGFTIPDPGFRPRACGRPVVVPPRNAGQVRTLNVFGDAWDAFTDIADATVGELISLLESGGAKIEDILAKAYAGAKEAIDFLRELANSGYCALAGKGSREVRAFVVDRDGQRINVPWVAGSDAEPIRRAHIRSTGGPLGVLLVETDIAGDGSIHLRELCHGISYDTEIELQSPAAHVMTNVLSGTWEKWVPSPEEPARVSLGSFVGVDDPAEVIDVNVADESAVWFMGAQLGSEFAATWGIHPDPVHIQVGASAQKLMLFTKDRAVTACGEMELMNAIPFVAGPGFDADIFASRFSDNLALKPRGLGVALHEYGHYAVCEAIREHGGKAKLDAYLYSYLKTVVSSPFEGGNDYMESTEQRNTGESLADLFVSQAMGYTDYFAINPTGGPLGTRLCPAASTGETFACMDPDAPFPYTPITDPPTTAGNHALMASRVSVKFDWFATSAALPGAGKHVGASYGELGPAIAMVAPTVTTAALASALAAPGTLRHEAICQTFFNHGWTDCPDFQLSAMSDLVGKAMSTTQIDWSWLSTSYLATELALENEVPMGSGTWSDVAILAAPLPQHAIQTVTGGPNTVVRARLQTRRPGSTAKPGNSMSVVACTLAANVGAPAVAAAPDQGGVSVSFPYDGASAYRIVRTDAKNTAGIEVARLTGPFAPTVVFVDTSGAPGATYAYRVNAENCSGQVAFGTLSGIAIVPHSNNAFVYVRDGASSGDGTRQAPFGTVSEALSPSVLSAKKNKILIATGTYAEFGKVPAVPGTSDVLLFGGYDATFDVRDTIATPTHWIGSNDDDTVHEGSGEINNHVYRPILRSISGSRVHVDGVSFEPGSRSCAPCLALTLAYATNGIELTDVLYVSAPGEKGAVVNSDSHIASSNVTLRNVRYVDGGTAPKSLTANGKVDVAGSRLIGRPGAYVLLGTDVTIRTSVVRGDAAEWMPASSSAVWADKLYVENSILAGASAVYAKDATIVDSLTYGRTSVEGGTLENSVFMADAPIVPLYIIAPMLLKPLPLPKLLGRGLAFVPLGGQGIVQTFSREAMAFGPITSPTTLGAAAMFPSFDVANMGAPIENGLVVTSDAAFAGDVSPDDPFALRFHPPFSGVLVGNGSQPTVVVPMDLDGTVRSWWSIGPYAGSAGKP